MLLTILTITIQLAEPAAEPQIEIPDSALRDPYGFVLSHCSPLVRRSSESLEACEYRVGEALRVRLPSFRTRPPGAVIASSADDPAPRVGTAFGGRCTTRQESERTEERSSSSGMMICGDDRNGTAARVLDSIMRPN